MSESKLASIVRQLSTVRTLDEIMAIVRTAARQLSGSDGATFVLRRGDFCYYADEDAIGPLWKGKMFPIESCISGWAMIHKQCVVIEDVFQDDRVPIAAYSPTFVKSLVMVPIRSSDPVGAIGNYWATPYMATQEQIEDLQALADTTAVAIENVNLYLSLENRIQELAEANRSKDELLMMVSHELRTPLNAIQGWSEMLTTEDLSPEERDEAIRTISRNARLQANIVDNMMEMSQIILKRFTLERQNVDLSLLVREVMGTFQEVIKKKMLDVSLISLSDHLVIRADSERMRQVVCHILDNAIKFTPANGKIEIKVAREGPSAAIHFIDNGEGFAADFIPMMFGSFRQADTSIVRKHGGLGLGLAIAKNLVEAHGGEIRATSQGPGKGAKFSVLLPWREKET